MSDHNESEDPEVVELEPGTRSTGGEEPKPMPKDTAKHAWDVEVDVYLRKAGPEPEFELFTTLPTEGGRIIFENNHRPGFHIRFNLIDETGGNYLFPPQPKVREACWSQVGDTCPQSPVWEVFDPQRVENGGATLKVYNDNPRPALGDFAYTLRVTNDGGISYCALDPIGGDRNGSRE
jgi:hypothetical protein